MSSALARRLARNNAIPAPSYAHRPGVWSGVHRLIETPLLINGAAPNPQFIFLGGQASAGGWSSYLYPTPPLALVLQAGTAPTYNVGSPLLGSLDDGVRGNGGGYFREAVASSFSGTPDFWVEALIKTPTASGCLLGKCNTTIATQGLSLYSNGTSPHEIVLILKDAAANVGSVSTGTILVPGVYQFLQFAVNISDDVTNGIRVYRNAADISASPNAPNDITNITSTGKWTVGAASDGSYPWNGDILYLALFTMNDWFAAGAASPTEWAAVAKKRFALLTASRPLISWAGDTSPVTAGSTSASHQEHPVSAAQRLFYMGAGAPRFVQRTDADGRSFTGALVEAGATQKSRQSEDLTNVAAWNDTTTISVSATPVVVPNGKTLTTVTIAENGNNTQHYIGHALFTSAAGVWAISGYVKAVNRSWAVISVEEQAGSGMKRAWFNLSGAGTVGTVTSGAAGYIRALGGGWYFVALTMTMVGAKNTPYYFSAEIADGNLGYQGLSQDSICLWGVQVEAGGYPSSYIPVTTADGVRVADSMYYNLTNILGSGQGAVRCRFLFPTSYPVSPGRQHSIIDIVNDATHRYLLYKEDGINKLYCYTLPDGTFNGPNIAVCDGKIHEAMLSWRGTRLDLWVDGVLYTRTMTAPPTGLTKLYVGSSISNAQAGPALVGDVKVFPRFQPSWATRGSGFTVIS